MSDISKYYEEIRNATSAELIQRGWTEISLKDYWYFMEVVPPIRLKDNAFMCGECVTHGVAGRLYDTFAQVDERYFMRPAPLHEFNPETYTTEIRNQFQI